MSSSSISADTHVRAWTPLVTAWIGASASGTPGQSPENIFWLTRACSFDTPLDIDASRSPITAMLNGESAPVPGSWPSAMRSLKLTPHSSAKLRK